MKFNPEDIKRSFKPYYNWITFNTDDPVKDMTRTLYCFKPYYNWITFNTLTDDEHCGATIT